jgi:hypothetical protein
MTDHRNNQSSGAKAQNRMKRLPRDTNAAIRDVMETIDVLGKVYAAETQALHKTDTHTFLAIQSKKIEAAHNYEMLMGQMMARKGELSKADPSLKNSLKALHKDFSDLSQKNIEAIERMQRCTERLGNTIRNAAIRDARNQRTFSYEGTGAFSNNAQKRVVSSGLSETV